MATQSAIVWPDKFLPGTTDNFVSNEVIAKDVSARQIWPLLSDISQWSTYYGNCSQITPPAAGPRLEKGGRFSFSTFGFPPLACEVTESVAPAGGREGRIAWRAWMDGEEDEAKQVEVYHAWLVEDLPGARVRILTQESQTGEPVRGLAAKKPNVMLNGHQDWLDGLVATARGEKVQGSNLEAIQGK